MTTSRRGLFGMLAAAPVALAAHCCRQRYASGGVISGSSAPIMWPQPIEARGPCYRGTIHCAGSVEDVQAAMRRGIEAGMAQANAQMQRDLPRRIRTAQRRYGIG